MTEEVKIELKGVAGKADGARKKKVKVDKEAEAEAKDIDDLALAAAAAEAEEQQVEPTKHGYARGLYVDVAPARADLFDSMIESIAPIDDATVAFDPKEGMCIREMGADHINMYQLQIKPNFFAHYKTYDSEKKCRLPLPTINALFKISKGAQKRCEISQFSEDTIEIKFDRRGTYDIRLMSLENARDPPPIPPAYAGHRIEVATGALNEVLTRLKQMNCEQIMLILHKDHLQIVGTGDMKGTSVTGSEQLFFGPKQAQLTMDPTLPVDYKVTFSKLSVLHSFIRNLPAKSAVSVTLNPSLPLRIDYVHFETKPKQEGEAADAPVEYEDLAVVQLYAAPKVEE